ncbi:hypothetical protein [Chromobacterium sphagni]|nr:hypothetical protein [Chromobacterium sphagni]
MATRRQADNAAPDPLALPWCRDDGPELAGADLHPDERLPLLCRGCAALREGQCRQLATIPTHEQTARCDAFQPLPGVTMGHCWLWRLTLKDGRLVWWSNLPPANQATVLRRARLRYGVALATVRPQPGWQELPAVNPRPHMGCNPTCG